MFSLFDSNSQTTKGGRFIVASVLTLSFLRLVAYRESSPGRSGDDLTPIIGWTLGIALLVLVIYNWSKKHVGSRTTIDGQLDRLLDGLETFKAYNKVLPRFRFVDLHQAAHALASDGSGGRWTDIDSAHHESMAMILTRRFFNVGNRRLNPAERISCTVGPGKEKYLPRDRFWVMQPTEAGRVRSQSCIVRIKLGPQLHQCTIEVATRTAEEGTALIERLVRDSAANSIYRNHMLDLEFAGEVRDEDGDIQQNESFDLVFKTPPAIGPDDIVMEPAVERALERNVLDFHRRRQSLMAHGLPGRRGVLLYGPPGTGKTYTCKFMASQLAGTITTLVASGESLLRVRTICNLARMLQPAMVVLEDVDLVYATRESGLGHNASLGKLMDELDGFGRDDHIIFILTTNAIDRVERAVSDRPGRISQCVFLGPPSDPLRRRYLRTQLTRYDAAEVDMDRLTDATGGTTQAFLKELVFRAVQIASLGTTAGKNGDADGRQDASAKLVLRDEHFTEALAEMRGTGGRAGETIIGSARSASEAGERRLP